MPRITFSVFRGPHRVALANAAEVVDAGGPIGAALGPGDDGVGDGRQQCDDADEDGQFESAEGRRYGMIWDI